MHKSLSKEQYNKINHQSNTLIAETSYASAIINLFYYIIIAVSTPVYKDFPIVFTGAGILLCTSLIGRIIFTRLFLKFKKKYFFTLVYISILLIAILWASFYPMSLHLFGFTWPSLLSIVIIVGTTTGSTGYFYPNLKLSYSFMTLLFAGLFTANLQLPLHQMLGLNTLSVMYYIFMYIQVKKQNTNFWKIQIDNLKLSNINIEMDNERKRYQDLFHNTPVGICRFDLSTKKLLAINNKMLTLLDYKNVNINKLINFLTFSDLFKNLEFDNLLYRVATNIAVNTKSIEEVLTTDTENDFWASITPNLNQNENYLELAIINIFLLSS